MGRLIEGFWDCKYCGTKGIRGSIRECPDCKRIRDNTTKFYLDTSKITYVPEKDAQNINRNPDWICKYCGKLNSDDSEICIFCDAPRTTKDLDYLEYQNASDEEKEKYTYNTNNSNSKSENYSNSIFSSSQETEKKSNSFPNVQTKISDIHFPFKPLLITLAVILAIFGIVYLCIPKEQEILVQEISWEYTINIERYKTVTENNIYLPTDARLLYFNEEIAHYEDVLDHYETKTRQVAKERLVGYEEYVSGYRDLGNGYFEEITSSRPVYETYYETETYQEPVYRKEPVYRIRYYYEIDKWVHERSVVTRGTSKETYFGEAKLHSDERISSKNENYYISGLNTKKDKYQKYSISFDDWNYISVDKSYKFNVTLGFATLVK